MDDLKIGDVAPAFEMMTDSGTSVSLSDFAGKNIVLYFYPKDNTPGCTLEGKNFSDLIEDFGGLNTVVIGVSKDNIKSHCIFRDRFNLKVLLGSDEDGSVSKSYGVLSEKSMFGKKYLGINRTTFLINKEGKIAYIWNNVSVLGHASEVLSQIKIQGL